MPEDADEDIVRFFHLKGVDFCTTRVDGAFTSPALNGGVQFIFFLERYAIPQVIEVRQATGEIIRSEGKKGVIRELQTCVILSEESARGVYARLKELFEPAPVKAE